jgi:pimeloyl-ACP methyl ester carboxylesterase
MRRPLMEALGGGRAVIAPDLPGVGDSGIPDNGCDKATVARDIHALVRRLGFRSVVGILVDVAGAAGLGNEVAGRVLPALGPAPPRTGYRILPPEPGLFGHHGSHGHAPRLEHVAVRGMQAEPVKRPTGPVIMQRLQIAATQKAQPPNRRPSPQRHAQKLGARLAAQKAAVPKLAEALRGEVPGARPRAPSLDLGRLLDCA